MACKRFMMSSCMMLMFWCFMQTHCAFAQSPEVVQVRRANQADYVIITPSRYVETVRPLADFRQVHNGFSVAIVTTEEIYRAFGQHIPPDSAIRDFITSTLTGGWTEPVPGYFLIAGNVDAVPSHVEAGLVRYEDSVCIDQWYVEGVADTTFPRPAAAIGRFPARDSLALVTMVSKTIAYEQSTSSPWFARAVVVADYGLDIGNFFEIRGRDYQQALGQVWTDTVTVHIRESSESHATRTQFRALWSEGAAIVSLSGRSDGPRFSDSAYFNSWDVDSIAENTPLAFCMIDVNQRFERTDTAVLAVRLLEAKTKGAVATLAPTGLAFSNELHVFHMRLFEGMVHEPERPVGDVMLDAKRMPDAFLSGIRRQTLLGDPALVIKSPMTTGVEWPPRIAQKQLTLHQNYPNPFNPTTTIKYTLRKPQRVFLVVTDLYGRIVRRAIDGDLKEAGSHLLQFDAAGLPSGVYFYSLLAGGQRTTMEMVILQ
ncbi:MAG: C25 family cysteine peptidase [Bacteroidota bacterium]|nr:C25 family cysteine peptidase [Bacteroidota bacterium]